MPPTAITVAVKPSDIILRTLRLSVEQAHPGTMLQQDTKGRTYTYVLSLLYQNASQSYALSVQGFQLLHRFDRYATICA